ncbi:MAG TPA: isoprenylcysteine carboxylmethyltransferase family protein, partial [Thermoanaerobaculia bacterium]|nr:isoprenylcysteine carboxylmethyltransferase family protein [Thermoanaerobaculia bacterium]
MIFRPEVLLDRLFGDAWILWALSWGIAAFWRSRTVTRPSIAEQLPYRLLTVAGAILLIGAWPRHSPSFWSFPAAVDWLLFALTIAGFLFTWWARIHLGKLWSGTVTRKSEHHIIQSGPYRIVRHPIYTGLSLAAFATAFYTGRPFPVLGAAILMLSFYVKARLEERFLRQELGEGYDRYAQRVRMLIPFIFIALACAHAPKPAAQNPSPMVDTTRAHERLVKKTIEGEQFTVNKAEVLITPRAAAAGEGDLLIHFHGAAWVPFEAALSTNRALV